MADAATGALDLEKTCYESRLAALALSPMIHLSCQKQEEKTWATSQRQLRHTFRE